MTAAPRGPGTPIVANEAVRFYRFRSVDALVGPRQELANQEIFFAGPADLNDPLEGFHDIVWRGDAIAWRNHLRHYLLCLLQTVTVLHVGGPTYDALEKHDFSATTADRLPPPSSERCSRRCRGSSSPTRGRGPIPIGSPSAARSAAMKSSSISGPSTHLR